MENHCEACRKRDEELYWSRFQFFFFFQLVTGPFRDMLAIPQKFANKLREKRVGTISLKGPSGITWNVELSQKGDTIYLEQGWKDFVRDNLLEENDVLMFKYNGGSSELDVLIFDGSTLCEKEIAYFIRRCEHGEADNRGKRKQMSLHTFHAHNEAANDVVTSTPSNKSQKYASTLTPAAQPAPSDDNTHRGPESSIEPSFARTIVHSSSRRRPVTEAEKDSALRMAREFDATSEASFLKVLRNSHVYNGFFMSLPANWAKTYLPHWSGAALLKIEDRTWQVKLIRSKNGWAFMGGWKSFVVDNALEESDVCVFSLVDQTTNPMVLYVKIFRVVEIANPSCQVPPLVIKKGKRSSKQRRGSSNNGSTSG